MSYSFFWIRCVRFSLGVCVALTLTGCASLGTYNPATGRNEFIFISTAQETSMGRKMHEQIIKQYKISSDVTQQERLQRIGRTLARFSDRQDYTYRFYLLDNPQLNAFTTPGGRIYVFTGLMEKLKTDDELASVLAHEIGHCAAKHVVKKYQAAFSYNLIGSIISSQVDGGAGGAQAATNSVGTAMNLIFSAYGRQDEYESDRLGLKYMHAAGYDLNGMIDAFNVLLKESGGAKTPVILRTHPHLKDRITQVKKEMLRYPR